MDSRAVWQSPATSSMRVRLQATCMLKVHAHAAHPEKVQPVHCRVQAQRPTSAGGQLLPELSCHILPECLCSSEMSSGDEACPCCSPGKGTGDALQGAQGQPSRHRRAATA